MSTNNIKNPRIKQARQKDSHDNFISYPLGVDAIFTDMMSGLDLEEELKLGSNHYVTITKQADGTNEIVQYYAKGKIVINDGIIDLSNITHKVTITFSSDKIQNWITQSANGAYIIDNETDANVIVFKDQDSSESTQTTTIITMTLYQYLSTGFNQLHTKVVTIVNNNGNYTINEVLD